MERVATPIRHPSHKLGNPTPAGSTATEDGGQRYWEDTSEAKSSDKYPAGLPSSTSIERQPSSVTRAPERRTVSIDIRLTHSERSAIRARAQVLGVKPSAWGRAVMLDALDKRRSQVEGMLAAASSAPAPEAAAAVEQLRRIGINLNQALRSGKSADEQLLGELLSAVDGIRSAFGDRTQL